ncbi:MAG: rhodanese-like domain-containing protein [Rubrivivax sp.]|jgi:rhodanese-related sulfurtransferase|nr:rhodanese-like domain-containing protein [Rubrivivax sp.]
MTTTSKALVEAAMAQVRTLAVADAQVLLGRPGVVFVDVREPAEGVREGRIPGARAVPRGVLEFWADASCPWHRAEVFADPAARYVLFCAIGWRSALAAQSLMQLGYADVAHIGGGFSAWRAAGAAVEPGS